MKKQKESKSKTKKKRLWYVCRGGDCNDSIFYVYKQLAIGSITNMHTLDAVTGEFVGEGEYIVTEDYHKGFIVLTPRK